MKPQNLVILICLAGAGAVGAYLLSRSDRAASGDAQSAGALLLPDLGASVNGVSSIVVTKPNASPVTVTRKAAGPDGGAAWVLAEKGGYPVQVEQVKGVIVGLADLRTLEKKTAKPELYSKIGVQDPGSGGAAPPPLADGSPAPTPTLITLKDDKGGTLASVIVGQNRPGATPEVFVRKSGDAQSWLAQGHIEIPGDTAAWIERQVVNIPRERIKSVLVRQADGTTLRASRNEPTEKSLTVADLPAGRELSSPMAADQLSSALSFLMIDDVAPGATSGDAPTIATFSTFDGLVITATTVRKEGKPWVRFDVSVDEASLPAAAASAEGSTTPPAPAKTADDIRKEAAELAAKLNGWSFAIPDYKAKPLGLTMNDLLKPLAPPAPTPAIPSELPR